MHNIILFSKIGLSQNEIKQFDNIIKEIEINIKNILIITNEINKFISDIKLINDNCSIYENDNNNNYKYYSIECLNIINKKLKLKEIITLPKIDKEQIQHSVTTFKGSSGSPIILLLRDYKIIGIHRGFDNTLNFGTSMKYIIEDINKKIPLIEDIGKWELR